MSWKIVHPSKKFLLGDDVPVGAKNLRRGNDPCCSFLFYQSSLNSINKNKCSSTKIAAFDLDDTLIRTKSGHSFPVSSHDWTWLTPSIPKYLQQLYFDHGYRHFVIFSNQLLRNELKLKQVQEKVERVIAESGVPLGGDDMHNTKTNSREAVGKDGADFSALLAPNEDVMRKPCPLMWKWYCHEYLSLSMQQPHHGENEGDSPKHRSMLDSQNSFFVGDAAGRSTFVSFSGKTKDHSCADRKFAFNAGIDNFFTPEEFFIDEKFGKKESFVVAASLESPKKTKWNATTNATSFSWTQTKSKQFPNPPAESFSGISPDDLKRFLDPHECTPEKKWGPLIDKKILPLLPKKKDALPVYFCIFGAPRSGKHTFACYLKSKLQTHDDQQQATQNVRIDVMSFPDIDLPVMTRDQRQKYFLTSSSSYGKRKGILMGIEMRTPPILCKHFNWFSSVTTHSHSMSATEKVSTKEMHDFFKKFEPLDGKLEKYFDAVIHVNEVCNAARLLKCSEKEKEMLLWLS